MFRTIHARRALAIGAAGALMSLGAAGAAPGAWAASGSPAPSTFSGSPAPSTGSASSAPSASATPSGPPACCHATLSVSGLTAVGLGGNPVEFTAKVTNTATTSTALTLDERASAPGIPSNGLAIWYRTSRGAWQKVPLTDHGSVFAGVVTHLTLGPKEVRTLHLRLGLPMGEPHDGDSNGGAPSFELTSSLRADGGSQTVQDHDDRTVKVQGWASRFAGVPGTAVPGGAPIEFRATAANTTVSDYVNVTHALFTDRHTIVQVYRGGVWVKLTPVLTTDEPDTAGFYLSSRDYSAVAGSSSTVRVRVSWKKGAPLGRTTLIKPVIVNEGSIPFRGTYVANASAGVTLVRGASPSPSHSSSPSPGTSTSPSPTASAAPTPSTSPSGQLAATGSNGGHLLVLSLGSAGLLLAGGAGVFYTRRQRRA